MADKQASQQVPSIGRVVHYILPAGSHRAAVIVFVTAEPAQPDTLVNLWVFLDKLDAVNIGEQQPSAVTLGTTPGTYHWPEFVPPAADPGQVR